MEYFNELQAYIDNLITCGKIYVAFSVIALVVIFFLCCEILSKISELRRKVEDLENMAADDVKNTADIIVEIEKHISKNQ